MFVIDQVNSESFVDKRFNTEREAIDYVLAQLPSDDFAYIVANDDDGSYVCIVFQGQEWRPS